MKDLGAVWLDDNRCQFRVWAPFFDRVAIHLLTPHDRLVEMEPEKLGYHRMVVESLPAGSRYFYRLANGKDLPDPVSRYQPDGVHGPSGVVNPAFAWTDTHWTGIPLEN